MTSILNELNRDRSSSKCRCLCLCNIYRVVIVFLLLVIFSNALFAYDNGNKVYTSRDDAYVRLERLSRAAGRLGSGAITPATGNELLVALHRIDRDNLSPDLKAEYDYLEALFSHPVNNFEAKYFAFDGKLGFNLQGNIADYGAFDWSNATNAIPSRYRGEDVFEAYRYMDPSIQAGLEFYFGPWFALEGRFGINFPNHHLYESSLGWLMSGYLGKFNFVGDGPTTIPSDFPYRVSLGAGNEYFSFIMGRLPQDMGNAAVSNMMVADNFNYQEVTMLSFFSPWFTYHMSMTRFDMMIGNGPNNIPQSMSRSEFQGRQQIRVVHSFDLSLFDVVRFTIMLGTLYEADSLFDFRFFYPFYWQHNYQNFDNLSQESYYDEANNIMSLSLDYAFLKGWSLNVQFVMDQARLPKEIDDEMPWAWGILGNVRNTTQFKAGWLDSYIEIAYSNPYLFLNGKRTYDSQTGSYVYNYNADYIIGYHYEWLDDVGYTGFKYGPDTIMVALGNEFGSWNGSYKAAAELSWRMQGIAGFVIQSIDRNLTHIISQTLHGASELRASGYDYEHVVELRLGGEYNFNDMLKVEGGFYNSIYVNYDNIKNAPLVYKPMFTMKFKVLLD